MNKENYEFYKTLPKDNVNELVQEVTPKNGKPYYIFYIRNCVLKQNDPYIYVQVGDALTQYKTDKDETLRKLAIEKLAKSSGDGKIIIYGQGWAKFAIEVIESGDCIFTSPEKFYAHYIENNVFKEEIYRVLNNGRYIGATADFKYYGHALEYLLKHRVLVSKEMTSKQIFHLEVTSSYKIKETK